MANAPPRKRSPAPLDAPPPPSARIKPTAPKSVGGGGGGGSTAKKRGRPKTAAAAAPPPEFAAAKAVLDGHMDDMRDMMERFLRHAVELVGVDALERYLITDEFERRVEERVVQQSEARLQALCDTLRPEIEARLRAELEKRLQ